MINKLLYYLSSEEVRLILKRMSERPDDFTRIRPNTFQDPSDFKLTYSDSEADYRWRMLVDAGVFSRFESYVLHRRLRQLDIAATRRKVYEVLFN